MEMVWPSDSRESGPHRPQRRSARSGSGDLESERVESAVAAATAEAPSPIANCRGCGEAWSLRQWVGHGCAFGTLAIFFWDWSLRDEFIDEVQAWTGVPLVRIQYHL